MTASLCLTTCSGSGGPSRRTLQKSVTRLGRLYGNIDFMSPTSGFPGKKTKWPTLLGERHWRLDVMWTCRSGLMVWCRWLLLSRSWPTKWAMKTSVMCQCSGRSASGADPPWQSHKTLVGIQHGRRCQRTSAASAVGVVRLLVGICHCTVAVVLGGC